MTSTATKKIWEPIDFSVYFIFIRWPVLAAILIEIIFRASTMGLSDSLIADNREIMIWVWRVLVFIFLGWRTLKNFGRSSGIAVVTGLTSGLIIGLVAALSRFIEGFKVWKIFNVLTETAWVAIAGLIITVIAAYLLSLIKFKNNN